MPGQPMRIFLTSCLVVALGEMGDKTQLLAFSLASSFAKRWSIVGGIFLAALLNHTLAAFLGDWITRFFPPAACALILGVTFVGFALWTLQSRADREPSLTRRSSHGAFVTTSVMFFLAEMGDKTQFATAALGARYHSTWLVAAGSTVGMLASDVLAIFMGGMIARRIPFQWSRWLVSGIFLSIGVASLAAVFQWR